jgi:hypothetical protein
VKSRDGTTQNVCNGTRWRWGCRAVWPEPSDPETPHVGTTMAKLVGEMERVTLPVAEAGPDSVDRYDQASICFSKSILASTLCSW